MAWGNHEVRVRAALRGARVPRVLLPLVVGRDPRPGAPAPAAIRRGDRPDQHEHLAGGLTVRVFPWTRSRSMASAAPQRANTRREEWKDLPPIGQTFPSVPATADTPGFLEALRRRVEPIRTLQRLGHGSGA